MEITDRPDMNVKCADKLLELAASAHTMLEWGSGGSTIAISKVMRSDAVLYSYEDNKTCYGIVGPQIDKRKVVYVYAPEEGIYINGPLHNIHYSFILVDGVYRQECMERARLELSWDMLLLHDADRERYKPWMDKFSDDEYEKSCIINLWICERKK